MPRIYLRHALRGCPRTTIAWVSIAYPVPPSVIAVGTWYRNINLLSFAYACRPRLRDRLTLGGLTFPRNPWAFGDQVFHLVYRYSCRHYLFGFVQQSSRSAFNLWPNAPLPLDGVTRRTRSVGGRLEPR